MKLISKVSSVFIAICFALIFTKFYFLYTHEYYEPSNSEKMANFEADKVFQKRIMPIVFAKTISLLGLNLQQSLKVVCVINCVALLYGFRSLLRIITKKDVNLAFAYLLFIPVGWNYFVINSIYHSYDLPTLTFFCWGLVFFIHKKFLAFYLLYFIACFNRESTCFITIALFATQFQIFKSVSIRNFCLANQSLFIQCLAQTIIWFLIKFFLEYIFRDNPGLFYESTYSITQFIIDIWYGNPSWPYLDTTKFLGNPRCFLTLFGCVWIFLPFFWKSIPPSAKKMIWIIPPYLFIALVYANLMESRTYHEINVVLALNIVSGLVMKIQKN